MKNLSASVKQKLLNKSKEGKRSFNELAVYFCIERFLYRLSISKFSKSFVLKGAMLLRVWGVAETRPTKDIDMLGFTSNDESSIKKQIIDILKIQVEPDGLIFDISSIKTEAITEDADYDGIRILFVAFLGKARIPMQIDIGFGDAIYPLPKKEVLPTILDFPESTLLCYSKESVIAEKFEAMVSLGHLNSRMKDFFDIWILSRQFDFDGLTLSQAIKKTFETRETRLDEDIVPFSNTFLTALKQIQWRAFKNKMPLMVMPDTLEEVVSDLKIFLIPVVEWIEDGTLVFSKWDATQSKYLE